MDDRLQPVFNNIVKGNRPALLESLHSAVAADIPVGQIINEAMIPAMSEVGRLFEQGQYYIPEMLVAARAMQAGMNELKPLLAETDIESAGKVVIGTVNGDLHDIGKNLVSVMLEGAGFQIVDLGVDVSADVFVNAVREQRPQIVALSALLTTTMTNLKVIIDALTAAGLRQQVKVIVGGAPVTDAYAAQIGADAYAPDASRAVAVAKAVLA